MFFNRFVIPAASIAVCVVSGVGYQLDDCEINVCPIEIVNQAASQGFLKHVIVNCVDVSSNVNVNLNFAGEEFSGAQDCVTKFVSENPGPYPIPENGPCRQEYQDFVTNISEISTGITDADECSYDIDSEALTIRYKCWEKMEEAFAMFQYYSGHSIAERQCLSKIVRDQTLNVMDYETYTQAAAKSQSNPGFPSDEHGICHGCYSQYYDEILLGANQFDDLAASCSEDPRSELCAESTVVLQAREKFQVCSGYDIDFTGPVCDSSAAQEVEELVPPPYYAITNCAVNSDRYCDSMHQYFAAIEKMTGDSCSICYREFNDNVNAAAVAEGSTLVADCSGMEGLWTEECRASLAPALFDFQVCSGFDLNTVKMN